MSLRTLHSRSRGFTLIELLIVVAIIGIIAAILVPNLLDAIQKAKQKRTMADMRNAGTVWMSWLSDQAGAAAAGQTQTQNTFDWSVYAPKTYTELRTILVPQYTSEIAAVDGWGGAYEFGEIDIDLPLALAIRAPAGDGQFDGDEYSFGAFVGTDYETDIVWASGLFVQWPGGLNLSPPAPP